jgi:Cu(I)/Ag(I) efflux system membrane fusion protein
MKIIYAIILSALFVVNPVQAQQNTHSHTSHLDVLVEHYLNMKNALVADDYEKAIKALQKFSEEVRTNNEMNDHQEHAAKHQKHHGLMLATLSAADSSKSIEELRDAFVGISKELLTALENQNYEHPSLYVQFCPMANNGEGARWISDEEEIANPFYGQKMHKCGETVTKIE